MFVGGALERQIGCALPTGATGAWRDVFPSLAAMVAASELDASRSPDDLDRWLDHLAQSFGYSSARYVHLGHRIQLREPMARLPLRFLTTLGIPNDPWRPGDPAEPRIFAAFEPFEWCTRDDLDLPDLQREWLGVERLRGVAGGVAIPVQDYMSGPAYLSLLGGLGADADGGPVFRHLVPLAIGFHCRAKLLLPPSGEGGGALTDREISCLRHAASGIGLSQTAASLGIATRTVELYFARAVRKLRASNRIHAVAIALSAGLIQI